MMQKTHGGKMTLMRTMTTKTLGILLILTAAVGAPAQRCGQSFAKFVVMNSEKQNVSDVTIELIARLPHGEFLKFKTQNRYEQYGALSVKLSQSEADDLLRRSEPVESTTDVCGNPLTRRSNSTPVKNLKDFLSGRKASVQNFGFCGVEGNMDIHLLRISAPGYVTDHYLGSYLSGCVYGYSFVLTKLPKRKDSTITKPTGDGSKVRTGPSSRFHAAVVNFLGHDPDRDPKEFGQKIREARERDGLNAIATRGATWCCFIDGKGVGEWRGHQAECPRRDHL